MNKGRGLSSRSVLNTGNGLSSSRGFHKDFERTLKDIKQTNFHNNLINELLENNDNQSKLEPQPKNNNTIDNLVGPPTGVATIGMVLSTDELAAEDSPSNIVNNIDIPKSPFQADPMGTDNEADNEADKISSTQNIDESKNDESIDESKNDEMDKAAENYNIFSKKYELMLQYQVRLSEDFIKEFQKEIDDKLEELENENLKYKYDVDFMLDDMKLLLINLLKTKTKKIQKSMESIENRTEHKNKTQAEVIRDSKVYRKYYESYKDLNLNIKDLLKIIKK